MKYRIIKLGLLLNSLVLMANAANIAYIPKAAPGDTATAGAGKQWPTTRFIVSDDCIIDNLTGLMWAKNANLLARGTWGSSSTSGTVQYVVAQMNTNSSATGYHLCGYSDWRLPAINELQSLFNYAAVGGDQATWLNSQGFTNVQSSYWSSTPGGTGAWYINMAISLSSSASVSTTNSAWPVRGGV